MADEDPADYFTSYDQNFTVKKDDNGELSIGKDVTPIKGSVSISGDAMVGSVLTANYTGSETVSYQWYRGDSAIWFANSREYTLTDKELGQTVKVMVTGTGKYAGSVVSAPADVVVAKKEPMTPPTVTYCFGDAFMVSTDGIKNGKLVIIAFYDGEILSEVQTDVTNGDFLEFYPTKTYTNVKVFVWNDFNNIKPVSEVEIVNLEMGF